MQKKNVLLKFGVNPPIYKYKLKNLLSKIGAKENRSHNYLFLHMKRWQLILNQLGY